MKTAETGAAKAPLTVASTLAQSIGPGFSVSEVTPGVTPFVATFKLQGYVPNYVQAVAYTIAPKPGSASNPVHVTFENANLSTRPRYGASLELPLFGLYSGYANNVSIQVTFTDSSTILLPIDVTTAAYSDPTGVYDKPLVLKPRAAGSTLGFDFFAMKSALGTPVIADTDGEIRWVGSGITNSTSTIFVNNGFVIGEQTSVAAYRLELDNRLLSVAPLSSKLATFTHNIDLGKTGYLGEFSEAGNIGAVASEFTVFAGSEKIWDMAQIISSYMTSQGDDAAAFVRNGSDWFHINATTYDPSDNSLIVSSRENFVIKVDYDSGNIIWIFGDPTKYWYTFPSLRAKALSLAAGGLFPIGQHGVSITSDGLLMLFNDGYASLNQPAGESAGLSRNYSAVSAYSIDTAKLSAVEAWRFDYGMTISSTICSSSYEALGKSLLVDYAFVAGGAQTRIVGLDSSHSVVFDFQYVNAANCDTSWNAVPIHLESMIFADSYADGQEQRR